MWSSDLLNTVSVRDMNLCIPDRIHANVGDRNLYVLGGLVTIESDRDNRLASHDIRDWSVAKGNSKRATRITT